MNFKMIVVVLGIAVVPVCVQAQAPNPPKASKPAKPAKAAKATKAAPAAPVTTVAAAVKTISGDMAKTQTYCDIGKLGSQIEDAEQKKDMNKIDELNKKMDEMTTKLGPEYVALLTRLEEIDPDSQEAVEIGSALETLDKLCAK
jgi:vancomycin resistance protein YoaR